MTHKGEQKVINLFEAADKSRRTEAESIRDLFESSERGEIKPMYTIKMLPMPGDSDRLVCALVMSPHCPFTPDEVAEQLTQLVLGIATGLIPITRGN